MPFKTLLRHILYDPIIGPILSYGFNFQVSLLRGCNLWLRKFNIFMWLEKDQGAKLCSTVDMGLRGLQTSKIINYGTKEELLILFYGCGFS